jgi:hypothetical protein
MRPDFEETAIEVPTIESIVWRSIAESARSQHGRQPR